MGQDNYDASNRRTRRSLVLLAAKVTTPRGPIDVRLRNLSQNGALLEADAPPTVGTELVFERGKTLAPARVAWSSDGRFGIEFLRPIEESEVLIHVGKPKPKPEPAPQLFRRTGFHKATLNEGERKLGEAWAKPLGRTIGD